MFISFELGVEINLNIFFLQISSTRVLFSLVSPSPPQALYSGNSFVVIRFLWGVVVRALSPPW